MGEATIAGKGEVRVGAPTKAPMLPQLPSPKTTLGEGVYQSKHIIVATGARPRVLPGLEPDGRLIWTYFEAMKPERFPKSLLIVGARRHRRRIRLLLSDVRR